MARLAGGFAVQTALFNDTQADVNARLHFVKQMRDSVDLFQSPVEYAAFLQHLLPAYLAALLPPRNDVMEYIPPPRPADAPPPASYPADAVAYVPGSCGFHEHDRVFQIRQQILDTLVRLYTTSSSPIGPWIPKILKTMQYVLEYDNEDSGVLALKTIFELHRVFSHPHANPPRDMMVAPSIHTFAATNQQQIPGQPQPAPLPPPSLPPNSPMVLAPDSTAKQVQPFLDFVQRMYENVGGSIVKSNFVDAFATPTGAAAAGSSATAAAAGSSSGGDVLDANVESDPRARTFVRACEGLKVLHELPMVVTLLLQNYAPNTKESAKVAAQNVAQALATNAALASAAASGLPPPPPPPVPPIEDNQLFILTVEHSNRIVDAMLRTLEQPFPQPPANILAEADPSLPAAAATTPAATAPTAAAAASSSSSSAMTDVVPAASSSAPSSSSSSTALLAQSTPRISRDYAMRWKAAFADFTLMQVKALNLLIYLLKDMTTAQCESLALNFLRLLANCPADALNSRKELLAAAANLFAGERNADRTPSNRPTKFHHAIKPHLDRFFDAWDHGLLTGSMQLRLTHDIHQIRHIAYQCLNLLVTPLRPVLTFDQLRRVVYIFSLNVHDATLPIATQTAAISTLFNLVDNCLAGNTLVETGSGFAQPIRDVVPHTPVLSFDAVQQGHVLTPTSARLNQGMKQCVELLFSDGRSVTCTPDHRFLSADGHTWIHAQDMQVGVTEIAAGMQYPTLQLPPVGVGAAAGWSLPLGKEMPALDMAGRREHALAFAGLLGFLLTDGCASDDASVLLVGHVLDVAWVQRDICLLTGRNVSGNRDGKTFRVKLPVVLHRAMLHVGVRSEARLTSTRGFPPFLLADDCPAAVVQAFLGGLFGGDGKTPSLSWDLERGRVQRIDGLRFSCSRKGSVQAAAGALLSTQLQHLFARVGMPENSIALKSSVSQVTSVTEAGRLEIARRKAAGEKLSVSASLKCHPELSYSLLWCIPHGSTLAFADRIGFRYCCHKQMRLTAAAAYYRLRETLERQKTFLQQHVMDAEDSAGRHATASTISSFLGAAKQQLRATENVHPDIAAYQPSQLMRGTRQLGMNIDSALREWDALKFFSEERTQAKYDAGAQSLPTFRVKLIGRRTLQEQVHVWDLTVPGTENFSAQGLVAHNCFRLQETDVMGRTILVRILVTVVRKLETIRESIPQRLQALADKIVRDREQIKIAETKALQHLALMPTIVPPPGHDLPALTPFPLTTHPRPASVAQPEPGEVVRDLKHMLSVIMYGAKTAIWCITNYRQRPMNVPQGQPSQATERIQLTTGEVAEMGKLLDAGLACFRLFHSSYTPPATPGNPDPAAVHFSSNTPDEKQAWWVAQKEYMGNFASLFSVLEARVFRDVFTEKMETIFAHIVADAPKFILIHVPDRFLSTDSLPPNERSSTTSSVSVKNNRIFAHILLTFLIKRMPEMCVSASESHVSAALVALFKLAFASVHDNESILRPFIHPIVSAVLRLANQVSHPLNYFGLLRALFRSIGGGKFEQLYKEFLPLLPELLNGLMKFQSKAAPSGIVSSKGPQSIRDISIELCLTVPARLSSLLPYIPILMKAVLLALQASDEQVLKLGLRTLEFWVDNLNPDYLYPHMCPVLNELMRSLTALLRPLPNTYGQTALSVLGKLGGRNRRFFIENYELNYRAGQSGAQEDAWNIEGTWVDDAERVANMASAALAGSAAAASVGSGLPALNSFSLNLARPLEIARGILLKEYPIPFGLQLTQQQQSTPGPVLAYFASHVTPEEINSSAQGSAGMYQRLIQKYNAWLVVQQALLSMMDMKGDFAAFRSKLPRIESALARKERHKREKAEEERERAEKEAADKEEAMMSEASYTGPDKSAAVAAAVVPPSPPVLLSRPMGPPASGDAERLGVNSRPQHEHTRTQFKSLLQCLIIAAGDPYLRRFDTVHTAAPKPANGAPAVSQVASFLEGLVGHFAMIAARVPGSTASIVALKNNLLENGNGLPTQQHRPPVHAGSSPEAQKAAEAAAAAAAAAEASAAEAADFAVAPLFEAYHLDLALFLDAILLCLAEENRYWSSAGYNTLRLFLATLITLLGPEAAAATPIVRDLLARLSHSCHEDKWEVRHAGIMGLSLLVSVLPQEWLVDHASDMLKALLFTVRDEISCFQDLSQTRATETLTKIVRDSVALAVERWERRRAGQDQAEASAAAAAESEEATAAAAAAQVTAGAMDTDGTADASAAADGAATGAAVECDASISALVRAESTAEQPPAADAAGADVDIHMADTEAKTDAEEKKDAAPAAAAAGASTATAPAAAAAAAAPSAEPVANKNAFDDSKSPIIRMLVNLLLQELVSSVAAVRDCVHALFAQMADDLHKPVGDMLAPYRSKMRGLCRAKISTMALAARIGHISAATYSMSLSPPLLPLQDLRGMVQEVLQEQQEDQNYGNNHPSTRALKTALITKLRVESISLMSVTLSAPEMLRPTSDPRVYLQLKDLKENIIRIFFRSLMSRSPDVVRVAKRGLKSVCDREKLAKDLLQQCLRPVLLNLSDYRKLSVVLLEGLSRLLELLSNCFNVTLGETLLKHLQQFADPESLMKLRTEAATAEKMALASGNALAIAQAQANRMQPADEVKVAAAIIDLFHLLPPAPDAHAGGQSNSGKFLEYLVKYTLQLEAEVPIILHSSSPSQYPSVPTLPSPASTKADEVALKSAALDQPGSLTADATISSPYRGPLIKFLNVNPGKSVEFFLRTSLLNSKPRQLFLSILRDPTAKPLRQHMAENPDLLVKWTFKYDDTFHWMSKNRFAAETDALNAHAEKMAAHAKATAEALATAQAAAAAAPAPSLDSAMDTTSTTTGTGTAAAPVVVDGAAPATAGAPAAAGAAGGSATPVAPAPVIPTAADLQTLSANAATAAANAATAAAAAAKGPPPPPTEVDEQFHDRVVHGVHLVTIISSFYPAFLSTPTPANGAGKGATVLELLFASWDSPQRAERMAKEELHNSSRISFLDEPRWMAEATCNYIRVHPENVSVLWRLLTVFKTRTLTDFTFVVDFLRAHITDKYTPEQRKTVISEFTRWYAKDQTVDPTATELVKARALKYLIIPLLRVPLAAYSESRTAKLATAASTKTAAATAASEVASQAASSAASAATPVLSPGGRKRAVKDVAAATAASSTAASAAAAASVSTSFLSDGVLDKELLDQLLSTVLGVQSDRVVHSYPSDPELRSERFRLVSLMLRYMSSDLEPYRGPLIDFLWASIAREEGAWAKGWALIALCRLFETNDMSWHAKGETLIMQVYASLLRQHQSDMTRVLVRKATDILLPVLHLRASHPTPGHSSPFWVRWTVQHLQSEGHLVPPMVHLLSLIVRHADVYYPWRSRFFVTMMAWANKHGMSGTRGVSDPRPNLALEICETIMQWDRQCMRELDAATKAKKELEAAKTDGEDGAAAKKARTDSAAAAAAAAAVGAPPSNLGDGPIRVPAPIVDNVISFLIRLCLSACENTEWKSVSRRTMRLLKIALETWPFMPGCQSIEHRLGYVERHLNAADKSRVEGAQFTTYGTMLAMVHLLLVYSLQPFTPKSVLWLQDVLQKCAKSTHITFREGVLAILTLLVKCHPPEGAALDSQRQPQLAQFYRSLRDHASNVMRTPLDSKSNPSINTQICMMDCVVKLCPSFLDVDLMSTLLKGATNLMKLALRPYPAVKNGVNLTPQQAQILQEEKNRHNLIYEALRIALVMMGPRIALLTGENRKNYLTIISHVIDRGSDVPTLIEVAKMLQPWVLSIVKEPTPAAGAASPAPSSAAGAASAASSSSAPNDAIAPPAVGAGSVDSGPESVMTPKERLNFVLKMCRFDRFESMELTHVLLDAVYPVFEAALSSAQRPVEMLQKMQRAFLLGLRCRDLSYRAKFIDMFHRHLGSSVADRMTVIFQVQDWESLSDSFWIAQATDLLFTIVEDKMEAVPRHAHVMLPGSLNALDSKVATDRVDSALEEGCYNQVTLPSFDERYWKTPDNLPRLAREETKRTLGLLRDRKSKAAATVRGAAAAAGGDSEMSDQADARKRGGAGADGSSSSKKRSADGAVKTELVTSPTAKAAHVSSGVGVAASPLSALLPVSPDAFSIMSASGSSEDKLLQSLATSLNPEETRATFLEAQSNWFYAHATNPLSKIIAPLRDLVHTSNEIAGAVWSMLLPTAWSHLTHDQRQEMVHPISSLLAKEFHSRLPCDRDHLHPVQVLLESFAECHPTPAITPELLRFLAKSYNSWHPCMRMLEQRILFLGPEVPVSANIPSYDALANLYRDLNEDDMWSGLWRRRVVSDYSHAALALEQFGMWPRAQDFLFSAISKKHSGGEQSAAEIGPVGRGETIMWEGEWVRCSKHLNQWEVLRDFAHNIGHAELQWEAAWRLADWNVLRDLCNKHVQSDIPNAKIYHLSLQIHDRKEYDARNLAAATEFARLNPNQQPPPGPHPVIHEKDVERAMDGAIQSSLREWQSYPAFVSNSHSPMLQRFQRLVELNESSAILTDMIALGRSNHQPNFKNFITTWKERLMNRWEELPVWSEILTWRCHMFNIILGSYSRPGAEAEQAYVGLHDLPWSMIKLAQVARKQQLPGVTLQILDKIKHFNNLDPADQFTRLREQIKVCLASPTELNASLNIICNTNVAYMSIEQRAELFRLKGESLQHLGYGDESNCFPVEDHEVLTSEGFLDYAAFRDRIDAGQRVSVACPRADGRMEWHAIGNDRLIVNKGRHPLVALKQEATSDRPERSSHIGLLVTRNHRMWAKVAAQKSHHKVPTFSIYRADALTGAKANDGSVAYAQFLCNSSMGVSSNAELPFVAALGLTTDDHVDAFLTLYGYWLGAGRLDGGVVSMAPSKPADALWLDTLFARLADVLSQGVQCSQYSISDSRWTQFFKPAAKDVDSGKLFASWVWNRLDAAGLRLVLRGLRSAASDQSQSSAHGGVIFTSSLRFRDEVQRAAIMAGYTSHWWQSECEWAVAFSEQPSVSRPTLSCATEIVDHKEPASSQQRTVWCVSVPTAEQLIVVRRVTKRDGARIIEASRPVVIGNTAFSACLSICDTYGKGWASWATFCDRVFTLKRDVQWADHALVCFIQAIANKFKRATLQMPRILSLLSFDRIENNGAGPDGPVLKAFGRFADTIPLWVWIIWIPQLLTSLARFEGVYIRLILHKLGKLYPQALYYSMRAYLIDLRERDLHAQSLRQHAAAAAAPPAAVAPVAAPATATAPATDAQVKAAKVEGGDAAMTDAATAGTAAAADAMPPLDGAATTAAAPEGTPAQANTSAASFASGTPAAIAAKAAVPTPTPVQALRDTPANQPPEGEAAVSSSNAPAAPAAPAPAPAGGLPPPGQNGAPAAGSASAEPPGADRGIKRERPEFLPNQAFCWVEDICNNLRRAHPSLTTEVERMLEEMKWHFKPEPEEELLAAVNSNLGRAYKQPPLPGDLISQEILARIKAIGDDYFRKHQDEPAYRKLIAFSHKYKAAWDRDFMPSIVHEPWAGSAHLVLDCTMTEFLRRLRRWKSHLHWILGSSRLVQPLEKLSPYLSKFHSWDIEIPGQYIHDREPNHEQHHLIARFDKDVVTKLNGPFMRRIGMLSEEGKCVHFFVQQQNVHINRSDERMQQLYVLLNRLMRNYKETRKRHLVHHIATMIPIHSRWNLKETDPSHITLQDVYEEHCAVRGLDADAPLIAHRAGTRAWAQFQQSAVNVAPHTMALEHNKHRLRVHEQICSTLVPDNILQRHMHHSIPALDQLFVFQGQFASQLALSGFLSYLLKVGDRTPSKITFSKSSGRIVHTDFFLGYNELGIIENNEPVPFRLTRNLERALSPTLIDGVVSSVMMTTNSCVLTHQEILKHFLSILIRDDIHSAQTAMARGSGAIESDQKLRAMEQAAREKVAMNVGLVMKRITMLMSPATHTPTAAERAAIAAGGHVPQANQPQPLNHKIHLLIKVATSKHKVSVMPPQWAPWF